MYADVRMEEVDLLYHDLFLFDFNVTFGLMGYRTNGF